MTETDLQHQSEIADARLEVAEQLWWPIAILAAAVVYLKWDNWFLIVAAIVAVYFLVTHQYRRAADKAEDEYFRAAKLGKYFLPSGGENA